MFIRVLNTVSKALVVTKNTYDYHLGGVLYHKSYQDILINFDAHKETCLKINYEIFVKITVSSTLTNFLQSLYRWSLHITRVVSSF